MGRGCCTSTLATAALVLPRATPWRSLGHRGTQGGLGFFSYWLQKPHLKLHPRGQVWTSPTSRRLTWLHPQAPTQQGFESRLALVSRGEGKGEKAGAWLSLGG